MNKMLLNVLALIVVAGVVLAGCAYRKVPAPNVAVARVAGNPAPAFGLPSTYGEVITLHQYRGRPILLNFWATWCLTCKTELPHIQAISQDKSLADRGLVILTIDIGEDQDTVTTFMKNNGYSFTTLLDTQQVIASTYNVWGIPSTFFIDKEGIIRNLKVGAFNGESDIKNLLGAIMSR